MSSGPVPPRTPTGEALRLARERLRLSQARFAGILGVRQATISEWESGRVRPLMSLARMQELLDAAGYGDRPAPLVDARSYAAGVLAALEGEAQAHAARITAVVSEARRVLGTTPSVPATTQDEEAAHLARKKPRRRPARGG